MYTGCFTGQQSILSIILSAINQAKLSCYRLSSSILLCYKTKSGCIYCRPDGRTELLKIIPDDDPAGYQSDCLECCRIIIRLVIGRMIDPDYLECFTMSGF